MRIINDILDFSKVEAGRLEVETIAFSLREVVAESMKMLACEADRKGLPLSHAVASNLPDTLLGDPLRLRQVILNLVGNAIKFSDRGEVELRVEQEPSEGPETRCHFSVRDTGVGIEADKQAAIFAPFGQADSSTTRIYGGTGLGLTISARLVAMMNGRIWVDSESGKGSTFHFTVDFGVQPEPYPAQGAVAPLLAEAGRARPGQGAAEKSERALQVLLVEDNPVNRMLAERVLKKAGYRVTAADSGVAALSALEQDRFDMVLMDVQMPGMDGIETTLKVREREQTNGEHMPILALTAHAMPADRARCLAAGMDGYLVKPIQPAMLLDALARVQVGAPERCEVPKVVLDRGALMECLEGDARLLAEIAAEFADACGKLMARVREAIASGDAERFAGDAHTLHGMFCSLSAPAAQGEARKLEGLDPVTDRDEVQAIYASLEREVQALASELSALTRDPADGEPAEGSSSAKKNPGERRGRLNAQREGGARGFQG